MTPVFYDVFILQAQEDENGFSDELVQELKKKGLSVWFCRLGLDPSMSLRDILAHALTESRYAVFIISPAFLVKKWSVLQLELIFSDRNWRSLILPLADALPPRDLLKELPLLDGRLLSTSEENARALAERLARTVRRKKTADEKNLRPAAETKGRNRKDPPASDGILPHDEEKL